MYWLADLDTAPAHGRGARGAPCGPTRQEQRKEFQRGHILHPPLILANVSTARFTALARRCWVRAVVVAVVGRGTRALIWAAWSRLRGGSCGGSLGDLAWFVVEILCF